MRALAAVIIGVGVSAWIIIPQLRSAPPDPRLWTFERYEQDQQSFEIARARGQVHEDRSRRRLRDAVLTTASRLESMPCDHELRSRLREAIGQFLLAMRNTVGQQIETALIGDRTPDATDFLNTSTSRVILEARNAGLVYREDLPAEIGILFPSRPAQPDHRWYDGRFACPNRHE